MKKVLALLLVLGVLVISPLDAFAASSVYIPPQPTKKEDNGNGTMTYYYPITFKTTGDDTTRNFTNVDVSFKYGSAITSFTCGDAGKFTAEQTNAASGAACKFTASDADPGKGSSFQVGVITVIVKKDAADEDCTIEYTYEGSTAKLVPETGVSVPYALIAGGAIAAAGVYFATKKKTKLQRI